MDGALKPQFSKVLKHMPIFKLEVRNVLECLAESRSYLGSYWLLSRFFNIRYRPSRDNCLA